MARTQPRLLTDLAQAERSQLLVDAVKDYAIYLLDLEGHVVSWNTGAQRFKGYPPDEIIGHHFSVFYTDADRAMGLPARALQTAVQEGRFEAEGWRVRKDGTHFWTHVVIDPVLGEDGNPFGFAKITRDITEQHRAQDEIDRARAAVIQAQKSEAIGQLAGGVAHDFNNLLTVICASSDFLRRPGLSEEKRARYIDAIVETANRAATLTGQLLAFARRQSLQPEVLDVGATLRGLQQLIGTTVGSSIGVDIGLPDAIQLIEADPGQFETAILNMVLNAGEAMPRGGRLRIVAYPTHGIPAVRGHAAATGDFVAVSIVDTGKGIAPGTLARIFEPFFTTKGVNKGTGLGLCQVYGFAKQSHGEIDVSSEVGVGTTFTLYLPRALGEVSPISVPPTATLQSVPARSILLVDDNEDVGAFAADLLRELGQSVVWAADGQAALAILQDRHGEFDLVLSDVVMPGISGIELAQQIRTRWPNLQVILTSGYSHVLAEEGSHGFPLLSKPYSIDGLLNALRQHPGEHAPS